MAKVRSEITLNNILLSASASNKKAIDPTGYTSGTYYFEVVGKVTSGTMTVSLRRVGTTTDDATLSFTETSYTRKRTSSFIPPSGTTEYFIFISGGTGPLVKVGRIVIIQDYGTGDIVVSNQFEIGNHETGKSNTTAAALNSPKYWKYTAANWSPVPEFEAEAVWELSSAMTGVTVILQEDNGSFASWTTKATIVNNVTASGVQRNTITFTPTDGRNYRIVASLGSNMYTYSIYSACIKVSSIQSSVSVTGSSYSTSYTGLGGSTLWRGVAYGNGTWVAAGYLTGGQLMAYSSDGLTWTGVNIGTNGRWATVKYVNGKFVVVSVSGNTTTNIAYSTDGTSWTVPTSPAGDWQDVTWNGTYWVFVGVTTGTNQICYTSDLSTFNTTAAPQANTWGALATNGSRVIAVASDGTDRVMYSDNMTSWTLVNVSAQNWGTLAYGNGILVSVNSTNTTYMYSTDNGVSWSTGTTPAGRWNRVTWDGNIFMACSFEVGTPHFMYSYNGLSWTTLTSPSARWGAVDGDGLGVWVSVSAATSPYCVKFNLTYSSSTPITKLESQYLLLNTADIGTGLQSYQTYYDVDEWDKGTGTLEHKHVMDSDNSSNATKLTVPPSTDITSSTVTGSNTQLSAALTFTDNTEIDSNVTNTTGIVAASRIVSYFSYVAGVARTPRSPGTIGHPFIF